MLTETAPELGARLDKWSSFYCPSTPGEWALIELAVMASVQRRRVLAHQTEALNHEIRTARYRYACKLEDEVEHYKGMLTTDPARAVLGLKPPQLLRHARIHELQFLAAYHAFLKGRKETAKTGLRPALPRPKQRPNTPRARRESATGAAPPAADPAETVEDGRRGGRARPRRLAPQCPERWPPRALRLTRTYGF